MIRKEKSILTILENSGKSTLSSELCEIFGGSQIETDGYHKYHRYSDAWKRLTHYNPEANNLVQLGLDVQGIFWKNDVTIPIYNHDTGYLITNEVTFALYVEILNCSKAYL